MNPEFKPFEKMPRMSKKGVVTEKIDGTNGQILLMDMTIFDGILKPLVRVGSLGIWAGSRNRWVFPGDDNFDFARYVLDNAQELTKLGPGQHFGEYWGRGIGRNYGLAERRFSLFNTARWGKHNPNTPACCHVVPVLGTVTLAEVPAIMADLKQHGSYAAEGFTNPEGVVIYYERQLFKETFEHREGKWTSAA